MKIIQNTMYSTFFDLVASSKEHIRLCSPFIKEDIIDDILHNKQQSSTLSLITNCNMNAFYNGALDVNALQKIIEKDYNTFNRQRLHAKMYIFDDKASIITSANLTLSGFKKNIELGVITYKKEDCLKSIQIFSALCNEDNTKLSLENIETIKNILKKLPKQKKQKQAPELFEIFETSTLPLESTLSGWTKELFILLNTFPEDTFMLKDIHRFIPHLQNIYPENQHPEAKIRQQLQILRDIGLLLFEGRGHYRKLWR